MKKYLLVYDVPPPERWASKTFTAEEFVPGMQAMGYTRSGVVTEHAHQELIGEPKFANLFGSMREGTKDGATIIRYETWAAQRALSAD